MSGPSIPRIVVAAPHGRSGKTTATLALCAANAARGLVVQPFKKGPDYIDPSWLTTASNRPARNLDPFMMSEDVIRESVVTAGRSANIVIIEGNHGLYDSIEEDGSGSTAALARLLQAPILLVVDAARMGRSIAALIRGYQDFESGTPIAGVILNNVAQARHSSKLLSAVERYCSIPVVGVLPRSSDLTIPDRHLGLIPQEEYITSARNPLEALRRVAEEHFDLDKIFAIATSAPPASPISTPAANLGRGPLQSCRVGIIRDSAFAFYYPENLEALSESGAHLVFINALRDAKLPPVDALYIGGGFPEVFAPELEANVTLRADIRAAIENDLPVYAECGGLMYLARSLQWRERRSEMVGALACDVEMIDAPQGHGYVQAQVVCENPFFARDTILRGHEYHHSRIINLDLPFAYQLTRGRGIGGGHDGIIYRNVLATYTHLHALGVPQWAHAMVSHTSGSMA